MGGACLRDHSHHWPARRAGRIVAGGWQQDSLARKPDAPRPDARSDLLRAGGDADALWVGVAKEQRDAVTDSQPDTIVVAISEHVGNRDRECLGDALSLAASDAHDLAIAERQRETLGFTLAAYGTP